MTKELIIACAGAGKSAKIINDAIARYRDRKRSLILTYTDCNQRQIIQRLSSKLGAVPPEIKVKGWFTFLLEDMVRPYQSCVLEDRVSGLNFNETDPHKRNGYTIRGRAERASGGSINQQHFVTKETQKAHSAYLSKFACRIAEETKIIRKVGRKSYKVGCATERLEEIYDVIFIDEVQDLVGWDFELLRLFSACSELDVICVGDFRQTIYQTANAQKKPKSNAEKVSYFQDIGFSQSSLNKSRRSVASICTFSDRIHHGLGFRSTISGVDERNLPAAIAEHLGVFAVKRADFEAYYERYRPTILRQSHSTEQQICSGREAFNFGKSKGMTFCRTLIIPTGPQKAFLQGNSNAIAAGSTDKAVNAFYVASTRARYSTGFLLDEDVSIDGVTAWRP
ncbi:UvrD-helicase domain-containing protein [Roseovarius rhodophyticola]|uniref:DNA 3'-5' helicase II n=1 Tax=Roseovarius rhodophyticola TaxID=3080827 RepID=A0ABZ2TKH7_9RHOB|nr:UvrD-helicase domain-containing protein [Roseovarius sp. W115]MDV2927888.1 UvrD-helicase domain-containing protein [Roseovarius sp. W115]